MKKMYEDIFIKNLPTLDLHGYDRDSARVAVIDFINDNQKMKNHELVIIHGIGSGIIKEEVWQTLKKNKEVIDYKGHTYNIGCTIVKIK